MAAQAGCAARLTASTAARTFHLSERNLMSSFPPVFGDPKPAKKEWWSYTAQSLHPSQPNQGPGARSSKILHDRLIWPVGDENRFHCRAHFIFRRSVSESRKPLPTPLPEVKIKV